MNDPHVSPDGEPSAAEPLRLADTPGYPLARGVDTTDIDTVPYDTGALSIRFGDLTLQPLAAPAAVSSEVLGEVTKVTYRIPALSLTGRYALDARPDEISTIDAGGNPFQPLTAEQQEPTFPAAPAPHTPPDEQTQERWHGRARAHRDALMRTENGRKLLVEYGKHNDTYCEVFAGTDSVSKALRKTWRTGGVTRRMAEHTYSVTDPGTPSGEQEPVNEWTDDESGVSYNGHAWSQRTLLVTTLMTKAGSRRRKGDDHNAERYEAAAEAAESFSLEVQQTGNAGGDTTPLTQQQVYQTVEDHSGTVSPPSAEAMARYQPPAGPEELMTREAPGATAGAEPDGWVALGAQDHAVIENIHRAFYHQEAAEAGPADNTLHLGQVSARLEDVRITVKLPAGPGGLPTEPEDIEVVLPEFDLSVQDEHWEGNAGAVAKERLAGMSFLLGLLRDSTAETLRHSVLAGTPGYTPPTEGA
ncbi:hypothetical protein [Streptomyces ardesiacus]|uniref:hypothetical protein n=1 Tax=Streptomyces ardesiacus TaxID=285564 RepID=UPI0006E3027E|nr:hypothetical protein [Streptomyces sp. NBRC 110030]